MRIVLKVEKIHMSYGDLKVLRNISFQVNDGEIVVLVGSNGAGKSSILKTISNVQKISSGQIHWRDLRINTALPGEIIERGIIHVPEGRHLFNEMTVEENLILGSLSARAKPFRQKSMDYCYELFPTLWPLRKQFAGTLSGGEQQITAIARGLMAKPSILMLDEPSLGLSPILVQNIFKIIKTINKDGMTILLVEQNVRQTLAFCHRAYILENGHITKGGTGKELLNDEYVREAYLGI